MATGKSRLQFCSKLVQIVMKKETSPILSEMDTSCSKKSRNKLVTANAIQMNLETPSYNVTAVLRGKGS